MVVLSGSLVPIVSATPQTHASPTVTPTPTGPSAAAGVISVIPGSSAFAVSGSPQNPEPAPIATGNAFVYPDLYNAAAGQGTATLDEPGAGSALAMTIDFSNVTGRSPGVIGYPELQYGEKPWCAKRPCASPPTDHRLSLPTPVGALPEITAVADYSVAGAGGPASGSFDLAYDLWMTRTPNATSASAGDLELMVWLDYSGASILPGTPLTSLWLPTMWSGHWTLLPWQLYAQSAVPRNASGHWTVAYLVLDPPAAAATVGVDLSQMIRAAGALLAIEYPTAWASRGSTTASTSNALYLDDIELGSEFRPLASSGPARFNWTLSNYCLRISPTIGGSQPPALSANCSVLTDPSPSATGMDVGPVLAVGVPLAGAAAVGVFLARRPRT